MINKIEARFSVDRKAQDVSQIIDIIEDLRNLNIPRRITQKIMSLLQEADFSTGDTVSYTWNPDGINFYYYPDLCTGGITFDFEKKNDD